MLCKWRVRGLSPHGVHPLMADFRRIIQKLTKLELSLIGSLDGGFLRHKTPLGPHGMGAWTQECHQYAPNCQRNVPSTMLNQWGDNKWDDQVKALRESVCLCLAGGQKSRPHWRAGSDTGPWDSVGTTGKPKKQLTLRPNSFLRTHIYQHHGENPVAHNVLVSWGEDGVVVMLVQRPWLSFTVRKERWQLLRFARSSSAIGAQLPDGICEPFLQGADGVPGSSRQGVRAGAGASWGLVVHRAHWWGDTAVTACQRVRLCCRQRGGDWV